MHSRFGALVSRLCKHVRCRHWYQGFSYPPHLCDIGIYLHIELPRSILPLFYSSMWPSKSNSYSPLYSSDGSEETITSEKDDIPSSKGRYWRFVPQTRASRIGVAFLTSISIFLILLTLSLLGSRNERYDCGHSPAEAVSKNCHFDMLAFAWVPIPCFDAEYVLLLFGGPAVGASV
jgi:hypothetical protein